MILINFFSTEDPLQIHYTIAREVLQQIGGEELKEDEKARDLLVRELVKECKNFAQQILPDSILKNLPHTKNQNRHYLTSKIEGKLWLDAIFLNHIATLGESGKERSKIISSASVTWMEEFQENKQASKLFRIWLDPNVDHYFCRFPKIFAEILWEDKINHRLKKLKKFQPAIPSGFWIQTIKPSLARNLILEKTDDQIGGFDKNGKMAISVKIPCLDKKSLDLVANGISSLGSLSGHRLLRWELKVGCQNIINDNPDPRSVITEGGFEGIAHLIGCGKNKATVTEVKSILYAQANAMFHMPNGDKASSLIILQEMEHHRNENLLN